MKQRLADLETKQKNILKKYIIDLHSPFLEDILPKPLPEKLKMPQLTSYEDGNNPFEHLDWSWNDLSAQFVSTFMGARAHSTPKERLVSIKQGQTESLRSYMDRFSKKIVDVDKISNDGVLMDVLSELHTKMQFWWSVHEDRQATY
ncbi:Uncharacterized protein Adt_23984 [Abeliophyllum distichum]|uniref:Retrotransposon gag domain-containing protein n=1 Tax=Abeliophyllum distichum TaxID=126358 RepID=A0ABD1SE21_9LAMI